MDASWSQATLVLALATGLVVATVVSMRAPSRGTRFHREFLLQILLFNLLTLMGLVVRALPAASDGLPTAMGWLVHFLLVGLKLAWWASFTAMTVALVERPLSSTAARDAKVLVGFVAVGWIVYVVAAEGSGSIADFAYAVFYVDFLVLVGAVMAAGRAIARAREMDPSRKRPVLAVSIVWFVVLLIALASSRSGFAWSWPPPEARRVLHNLLLIAFNVLPVFWILRIEAPAPILDLAALGLTEREREVAALVAEGLRNEEIADRLYVSLATIKEHNTRIFRKVGVRNRTELAMRVRGAEAD